MALKIPCRYPGCETLINSRSNLSGVCDAHKHVAGYCACAKCGPPYLAEPGAPATARTDTITVHVLTIPLSSSVDNITRPVTMPRPPWHEERI